METLRTDVVSLYDLKLPGDWFSFSAISALRTPHSSTPYEERLGEAFSWLLYGEALQGFERLAFPSIGTEPVVGRSLLLSREYRIGVFSVWSRYGAGDDPLYRKQEAWEKSEEDLKPLRDLIPSVKMDRLFPFMSIRVPGHDIDAFAAAESETIGRILTGGYDFEAKRFLVEHVNENISRRSYERFLLSWTDALGVYSDVVDENDYELTFMRALQLFEMCIVIRRIFRSLEEDIDRLIPSITLLSPRPWAVNRILQRFKSAERHFVISPPVASVEAGRLLTEAFDRFGIASLRASAANSCDFLDRRFQWAKTQLLILLGVVTYVVDKLKLFDVLLPWGK